MWGEWREDEGKSLGVWESVGEVSGECEVCEEALGEVWVSVGGGMKKCGRGVEKCVGLR